MVVTRNALVTRQVIKVDARIVAVIVLQVSRSVVDGFRPGERIQQIEAASDAFLELSLQCVVGSIAAVERDFDGIEVRKGPPRGERQVLARCVRLRLILVAKNDEPYRVRPYIGEI